MSWKEKCAPSILDLASDLKDFLTLQKGESGIIPTPFEALNAFLAGGLQGFVCLGSAPGRGKSAFAQQISIQAASKGIPALYIDLEHSKAFLTLRLLSSITARTIEDVKERVLADGLKIPPMMRLLRVWSGRVDPRDIRHHLRTFTGEEHLSLIVIDSLQKLPRIAKTTTKESVDIWLRELEAIKNEYPCVILVISELSRGEGGKNYEYPSLSSFKESGDIEYTAEQALMFTPVNGTGLFKLHVVKNRYGSEGEISGYVYSRDTFWCWRWKEVER